MPGPTEASLRHPWHSVRAGIAKGPLSPGRLPCGGDGTETRGPGSRPRPRRTASPAARSAPLSHGRAQPKTRNPVVDLCARSGVGVDCRGGCRLSPRAPWSLVLRAFQEPLQWLWHAQVWAPDQVLCWRLFVFRLHPPSPPLPGWLSASTILQSKAKSDSPEALNSSFPSSVNLHQFR